MAGTKSTIDMGIGTAINCSFAVPEVGPAIAAGLSVGKLFFDLFYPADKSGGNPMSRLVNQADLKIALAGLEQQLVDDILAAQKGKAQADYRTMVDAINDAVKNAGATKTAKQPMPGDTTVWLHGATVKFWDPIMENPSPLIDILNTIEGNDREKFRSVGLYSLTFGTYLLYCKTAMVFEVNENLKFYQHRLSSYNTALQHHNLWKMTKQGEEPKVPDKPELPSDGAGVVGSEKFDEMTKVFIDYRSFLGKAKGQNISKFAVMAKTQLGRRITYLEKVISDWGTGRADRHSYVQSFENMITVQKVSGGYQWVNAIDQTKGDVANKITATMQADMEKSKITGPKTAQWNKNHVNPDDLSEDDINNLKIIRDKWKESVNALGQAGKGGAPVSGQHN